MIRSIAADGRPDLGGVFRPIERPRVLERLAAAARYRIATLIAPAGFGKSVAVRQFLATVSSSVVYDVPSEATTLLPFVRGFADALAGLAPGLRRSVATALEGARDAEAAGRELGSWAATHLRQLDTLIVIDDLHVGEHDPEISRFLTTLVEATRGGPRWLFSSRSPLRLPLASWLAYGESDLVVDAVDLRFTLDEAKESARATRVAVREEELTAILELVDGWPTALAFALRTSTRANDLRALSGQTREMVYRYLAEQVWHSLDERTQRFLRTIAFLPQLDVRLAVAAGFDDAAAIIESLRERVAFITVVDAGVYQLHDLFREFIVRSVALEGDEALRGARITAARVLETCGSTGSALERYLEARALDDVVRVLAAANFALLESGHYDVVERALRALPSGALNGTPAILALRAAIEDVYGRSAQAERWYEAVLRAPIEDVSFRVAVAWRYALMLYRESRLDALPLLRALLERTDVCASDRAEITGMVAMTLALAGDVDSAKATIEEAFTLAEFAPDELRARTYSRAATVAFFAGDGAALERYAREGTRLAAECGAYGLAATLFSALVAQNSAAGRVPATAWYAAQVVANAERAGNTQLRAGGLRVQLECEAIRGDTERIAELEREIAQSSYRGSLAVVPMLVGRALAALAGGRFADARVTLGTTATDPLQPHEDRMRCALLAVACAAQRDRPATLAALADLDRAIAADGGQPQYDSDRRFAARLAALANVVIGRNVVAQRALQSLLKTDDDFDAFDDAIAALQGRNREGFAQATRALRGSGFGGIARVIEQVGSPILEERTEPEISLTAAEKQVLVAMAQGLSNQAIADAQRRTINTVRTHVSSILRKLGCESRGEAVAAARRAELI